jgi:hypothetical protein
VAVGIALAFTWDVAGSQAPGAAETGSVVAPGVEMTVEQAAAHAWASASTLTAAAGAVAGASPQAPDGRRGGTRPARQAHRTGRLAGSGCPRVRTREPALQVRVTPVCGPRRHAPKKPGTDSLRAR